MEKREFVDMILDERIGSILQKVQEKMEDPITDKGEEVLQGIEEEKRTQIENYMDHLMEMSAEQERRLYLGGFRDGICLLMRILRIEKNGPFEKGGMEVT